MQMDDMILVSIDDHMVEPPDMYKNHLPAKWLDQAPKIIRNAQGIDEWTFQGEATATPFGMAATVGWPREEWGFNPGSFSELRPGCWDVHERVRDMDVNGVLASMCFPTMAGFNARTFTEAGDKELSLVMLKAYNDWAHRRVVRRVPGSLHPAGHRPDVGRRPRGRGGASASATKGCRSISFLEAPHAQGFPSFLSGHWDPMLSAMCDENMILSLHIGAGFDLIKQGARGTDRPPHRAHRADLGARRAGPAVRARRCASSPTSRSRCPRAASAGSRSTSTAPTATSRTRPGSERLRRARMPSDVFREHILACYITDPSGLELRAPHRHRHHRLGVRLPPHRHDVAGVARVRLEGVPGRRRHRRRDPHDHVGELLPLLRLGPVPAHAQGAGDGGCAARAGDRRRHHAHVARGVAQEERGRRYRQRLTPRPRRA